MRIKLIDVENRLNIKYSKSEEVYNWGDDNAYPQLVESLIGSSVTAKQCADLNAKYIYGKGFEFEGKTTIVNKDGLTVNQIFREATKEFSEQNNLFFHVNYNALYQITSVNLVSSCDARIGKADSTGYSGKFVVYDNWDKVKAKSIKKADFKVIDKFNPNAEIIDAQVEAAGGWAKYKGQLLHIRRNFKNIYCKSNIDCVLLDSDSEHQASVYKNVGLRKGFFGAKLMVTKPFDDDYQRKDFENTITDLKGAANSSGILLLEASQVSDVLAEQFLIQNIDSNIDDKMFESTENSTARNIRKAFGVPSILVDDSDNSIFGNSGELLKAAKAMHWENKEEERNIICEAFKRIFIKWHEPINPDNNWNIIPIITLESKTITDA